MKRFFTILLAVSLVCACGDIEPLPNENGNGDQVENGGNSGDGTENEGNEGSGNEGNEGSGDSGNEGSGNEGSGNEGNEGSGNEGNNTPAEQSEIVILSTSEGWPTSYPTSQSVYALEGHEFYLLNAAIYNGMQFKKQTGYIANKSVFGTLVRIELTKGVAHTGKMALFIGDSEMPTENEIASTETSNGYMFDCTDYNAKYFKLANTSGNVVNLTEIRIVYLTSGSNTPGGGSGGNEGGGNAGNEGGNQGGDNGDDNGGDNGGGTTPTPDPTPNPNPTTGNVYRSGWAELPIECDADGNGIDDNDATLYYAHHLCAGSEQNAQRNGKARNFTVCFSAKHHCPVWVAAPRHKSYESGASRTDAYQVDPKIPASIQYNSKSTGGGCNKGHMLGSAERLSSSATNRQVFYYSNIAPQYSDTFNTGGGAWNKLEDHVDGLVCADTLYVVIGCYFDKFSDKRGNTATPATIEYGGRNDVSRPTMFYYALLRAKKGSSGKAVWNCSADELQCAAFVKCHEAPKGSSVSSQDMMSISELENLTGFTYFPNVPNAPKSSYKASDWGL